MKFYTWAEIKAKVQRDLDIESEVFVNDAELLGYCNDAIDEAEAEIMGVYSDYFLARETITLVSGTEEYSLPSDIFAHKVRRVMYNNGSSVYEIKRMRDWHKIEEYEQALNNTTASIYRYFIINDTAGTPKLLLSPEPTESGAYIKMWHLRNATRLTGDSSTCDIPEFITFIYAYIREQVMAKEGHPSLIKAVQDTLRQRELMKVTLQTMVPDGNNTIEPDLDIYYEMS